MPSTGDNEIRGTAPHRRLAWAALVAFMVLITAGCTDEYEPTKTIEGVFHPSGCVQMEGRRAGWLWPSTTYITVCQPIRVSELGVMTYGWEVREPGWKAEVGRLEFSDADVYIVTERLRQYGRFEYRERESTLDDWRRNHPVIVAVLALVALVVAVAVLLGLADVRSRRERERQRLEAEAAARAAARAAALATLRQLAAEAQGAANSLPIILGEAEIAVDRAQDELRHQLYSPFWEAMEEAASKLGAFQAALSLIDARRTSYRTHAVQLDGDAPQFTLGLSVLPDPTATHIRLTLLYREAQSNPHFAMVYEQRRTNAILIAGFQSLGQAIERLGDRIVDEVTRLAASMDCRLASLELSLESAAAAAAEQGAALRAELQRPSGGDDAVLGQLRQEAESRSDSERSALRMLDNIQRRKEPTIWDRPSR